MLNWSQFFHPSLPSLDSLFTFAKRLQNLLLPERVDPDTRLSKLGVLAAKVASGKPAEFLEAWREFQNHITINHIVGAGHYPGKNVNVLWLLVVGAATGHPEPFLKVWEKFHSQITLGDLLKECDVPGYCILSLFSSSEKPECHKLLEMILQRTPGILPKLLFNAAIPHLALLVEARNRFFLMLNQDKRELFDSPISLIRFLAEASKVYEAGYLNAFYDLGHFFLENGNVGFAAHAFEQLPSPSYYYSKAHESIVDFYIRKSAEFKDTDELDLPSLFAALFHALHTNEPDRSALANKIAVFYTKNNQFKGLLVQPEELSATVSPKGFLANRMSNPISPHFNSQPQPFNAVSSNNLNSDGSKKRASL